MPNHLDENEIISAMMHDKKFKESQIVFVLPVSIGKVEVVSDVKLEEVISVIQELKKEGQHV
ncbi:3-dehydroquinate synthase [compost metagenome]